MELPRSFGVELSSAEGWHVHLEMASQSRILSLECLSLIDVDLQTASFDWLRW